MKPRRIVDRFEVLEVLSYDAQGEELRARDETLDREVILVRRSGESALLGKAATERALREARALAALLHPSIQKLYDVIEDGDGPLLVLEPVAGESLAARLAREERLAPEQVRRLGIELADALAAVHAAGAVHRDVSEENVVLRADGSTCLAGFRLAKPTRLSGGTSILYDWSKAAASERALLPAHPAPEQLEGEAASARTDLFALGCVLYRALTGSAAQPNPLAYGGTVTVDAARLAQAPPALARLVTACLAKSPMGRPQTAAEVRDGLRSSAMEPPPAPRPRRATSRIVGLALAALLVLGLVGFQLWPRATSAARLAAERGVAVEEPLGRAPRAAFAPGFRSSRALLIGIGEAYRGNGFPPLTNAVADVRALAEALEASPADRWQTRLLLEQEATYDGIRAALSELENELEPEDRVLIYFAGHGVPHERSESSGFLIPADGLSLDKDPLRSRWLHFESLKTFLADVSAKHVLLAMDCCFGGRLASLRSAGSTEYQERFLQSRAVVVLAAGRADEAVSDGGPGGHSPFAEVFLAALTPGNGAITSSMIHAQMLRDFADRRLPQTPVLTFPEDVAPGEFVFLLER